MNPANLPMPKPPKPKTPATPQTLMPNWAVGKGRMTTPTPQTPNIPGVKQPPKPQQPPKAQTTKQTILPEQKPKKGLLGRIADRYMKDTDLSGAKIPGGKRRLSTGRLAVDAGVGLLGLGALNLGKNLLFRKKQQEQPMPEQYPPMYY